MRSGEETTVEGGSRPRVGLLRSRITAGYGSLSTTPIHEEVGRSNGGVNVGGLGRDRDHNAPPATIQGKRLLAETRTTTQLPEQAYLGFIAGLVSGIVGVFTGFPLDTLKVRITKHYMIDRLIISPLWRHRWLHHHLLVSLPFTYSLMRIVVVVQIRMQVYGNLSPPVGHVNTSTIKSLYRGIGTLGRSTTYYCSAIGEMKKETVVTFPPCPLLASFHHCIDTDISFLLLCHVCSGPPLVMTGIVQTLNFGFYDNTLRALTRMNNADGSIEDAPLMNYFVAGFTGEEMIIYHTIKCFIIHGNNSFTASGIVLPWYYTIPLLLFFLLLLLFLFWQPSHMLLFAPTIYLPPPY